MNTLALDWATAIEASPPELARIAAANDLRIINCPVYASPVGGRIQWDMLGDTPMRRETKRALADEGVKIDLIEAFYIQPNTNLDLFARAMESGAWLGATQANIVTQDDDPVRLRDTCSRFHETAHALGLELLVEYSPRMTQKTLDDALNFIGKMAKPMRVQIDALHTTRSAVPLSQIAALDSRTIGRVQLCDGPASVSAELGRYEAQLERMIPGDGSFALKEFLSAVPRDVVIGLEVPLQSLREAGVSAAERVRRVTQASRALIADYASSTY